MINLSLKQKIVLSWQYPQTSAHFVLDKFFSQEKTTSYPRIINLFVTENCNFACPMCHIKASRQQRKEANSLRFEEILPFLTESIAHKPSFQLVGGEPFLNSDIFKIINFLSCNGMPSGLTTNGLLLEQYAEEIIKSKLSFLAISLDGFNEEVQYKRGYVKNSFNTILKGIKKIVDLKGKSCFPNIRIATVISHINYNTFDQILPLAENLGVNQWSISHYFYYYEKIKKMQEDFNKKYHLGSDIWGDYIGENKDFFNSQEISIIKEKYQTLLRLRKKHKIRISIQDKINIEKYYTGSFPEKESKCSSPYHQIFIRGNGDIEMCQGYILGNIKKEKLSDVWHNSKSNYFRSILKNHYIPACFRCCALDLKLK